ncbi:HIT-like protein [Hesseltinella vesiculosa]|uniref:m7GpppX diphosphatase n=1 Tax=Hesseltinella vesiculosa TaxID=101127 RepID=A0A1X2GEL5_9FUNG|nr:HIT-like protein [Hesseltinella vesiculosa]
MDSILKNFSYERTLSQDTQRKVVHLLGQVQGKACIVTVEKLFFDESVLPILTNRVDHVEEEVQNNIYGWCLGHLDLKAMDTRIKYVYPATELHIRKHEQQQRCLIVETPRLYEEITKPYIDAIPASRIAWVMNILEGTAEKDRVLFHDKDPQDGFVILPDMKWDGHPSSLYLVAIVMQNGLTSLRQLSGCHVPLLKHIQSTVHALVKEKYQLDPHQIQIFFHYQPSYYHLHLHITALSLQDPPGATVGQAHLLDTVLYHLEHIPGYYQQATLPFVVGDQHPLYQSYQAWLNH